MKLNNFDVVDRHNRPTVLQAVALQAYFVNDGVYTDPYTISGVSIYHKADHVSPSSILDSEELLDVQLSSNILMHFETVCSVSDYTPSVSAVNIYKVSTGRYVVVLDGRYNQSGTCTFWGGSSIIPNRTSAIGDYLDVWTVQLAAGSKLKTVIQNLTLYDDTFFVITEPILLKPINKLINKHITYGSKVDLKFTTEVNVENGNIDEDIKNIFQNSVITSAMVEIQKVNHTHSLPGWVTVSSFENTVNDVLITSDNTIIFNWNTTDLVSHASVTQFDGIPGDYAARVKFTILNETYISPWFYFVVK